MEHDPSPGEKHFKSLRQITFGGENAEAYWSFAEMRLIFPSTRPGDTALLCASTRAAGDVPPAPPDRSRSYVWPIHDRYDIYVADADGKNPRNLAQSPGYDAEATVSPKGDRILLTSTCDGDIEPYSNVCVAEWTD
jgi:Tol biopolymer transport system component